MRDSTRRLSKVQFNRPKTSTHARTHARTRHSTDAAELPAEGGPKQRYFTNIHIIPQQISLDRRSAKGKFERRWWLFPMPPRLRLSWPATRPAAAPLPLLPLKPNKTFPKTPTFPAPRQIAISGPRLDHLENLAATKIHRRADLRCPALGPPLQLLPIRAGRFQASQIITQNHLSTYHCHQPIVIQGPLHSLLHSEQDCSGTQHVGAHRIPSLEGAT